ncbi:MAG: DUF1015 domain-containing protein, partial [Lachnospiraceae bacterium]|nr:DUF1015 domain-containing protein [Lachnospiraceae bacterium]
ENGGQPGEYDYFLSVLFPRSELKIMPYNRVLKDLNGHTPEELLSLISKDFSVEDCGDNAVEPEEKGTCGLYLDGKWYRLTASDRIRTDDPVKGLDVSLLQDRILEPLFGIADPAADKRIDFVGGIRGTKELEKRCREDCAAAFSMHPTSMDELFAVADAGMLMPPKSTWFEPKLLSGLFIHMLK